MYVLHVLHVCIDVDVVFFLHHAVPCTDLGSLSEPVPHEHDSKPWGLSLPALSSEIMNEHRYV